MFFIERKYSLDLIFCFMFLKISLILSKKYGMREKRLIFAFFIVLFGGVNTVNLEAQENYTPIGSKEVITEDFNKVTVEKYKDQIQKNEKTKIKKSDSKYQKKLLFNLLLNVINLNVGLKYAHF